jgi:hypothetical protein
MDSLVGLLHDGVHLCFIPHRGEGIRSMKTCSGILAGLVAMGAVLASLSSACAQELYTTQEDFTGWSDNSGGTNFTPLVTAFSTDSSTTNGLGNPSNPGGTGTSGSITVTRNAPEGNFGYFYSQGASSTAFLAALGTSSNGGAGYTAASGTIQLDFVPATGGTYFGLGIVLNYNSNFGQFFPSGTPVNNGTYYTEDINYTINSTTSANYFQLGVIWNSDAPTGSSFTLDNIQVVPEPASLVLLGLGGLSLIGVAMRRRDS